MKPNIDHNWKCSKPRLKSFMQIRPYYDGLEILVKVYYCPECFRYDEVNTK